MNNKRDSEARNHQELNYAKEIAKANYETSLYKTELARLEYEKEIRQVLNINDVMKANLRTLHAAKDMILALLPAQIAMAMSEEKTEEEQKSELHALLTNALKPMINHLDQFLELLKDDPCVTK